MADTLHARIALDGGDQIKATLVDLGAAGKKAFDQIGKSANSVDAAGMAVGLERIKVALSDLAELAGTFGKSLTGNFVLAGGAFAGIAAAMHAIGAASESSTNKLVESAKKLGTSTDELQRLRLAASASGIGEAELSSALGKIKAQFDEAGKGAKSYFRSLGDIGTASKQFDAATGISVLRGNAGADAGKTSAVFRKLSDSGKDYTQTIENMAGALANLDDNDPAKKGLTDNLEKTFGKDFASKIEEFGKKIRTTKEVYEGLGLSVTDTDKEIAKASSDSLDRLKGNLTEQKAIIGATLSGIVQKLGTLFLPGATARQDAISDFIEAHRLDIVNFVKDDVFPAMTQLHTVLSAAGSGIAAVFSASVNAAKRAWEGFKSLIAKSDLSSFDGWKTAARSAFDGIATFAGEAFARIVEIARSAYESMKNAALVAFPNLASAFTTLEDGFSAVMERLKSISGTTWLVIGAGVLAFVLLFSGSFGAMALSVVPFWSQILRGAETVAPGLVRTIAPIRAAAVGMFGSIVKLGQEAFGALKAMLSGDAALGAEGASGGAAFAGLRTAAVAVWNDIRAAFVRGIGGIRATIEGAFPGSRVFFKGIEESAGKLMLAVKVLSIEFAGFLGLISFGKIHLSGMEALILAFGLSMSGLLPIFTSVLYFLGLFSVAFATIIKAVIIPLLVELATNPAFAAIVLAIGAIGFALYETYAHWDELKAIATTAIDAIKAKITDLEKNSLAFQLFEGALRSIRDVANGVADALDRINEAAAKAGHAAHDFVVDATGPAPGAKPATPAAGKYYREQQQSTDFVGNFFGKVWREIFSSAHAEEAVRPQLPKAANVAPGSASGVPAWAGSLFGAAETPKTAPLLSSSIVGTGFKSVNGGGGLLDSLMSLFGGGSGGLSLPNTKRASSAKTATKDLLHESDDEARIRDDANRYFGMPVIGKRALDASVGRNDQFVSEGAMKRSVERNTSDFPVYPGYLPKNKGDDDEASLSGSVKSTASAFDGLIGKMGQFAAALVAPGGGGLQMPGLGGMAIPQMAMAPAFAGGGSSAAMPNAGMVSFTLDIGGVRSELTGLREDVARLERASVQAQMAQTTKRSMSWDT